MGSRALGIIHIWRPHGKGEWVRNFDPKLRMVDDGGWGEGGGRRVKYGSPHQIFICAEEKYVFMYSQLCIWCLPALDDHFSKNYRHIYALRARYYK